LRLGKIELIR
jgi:hypothetical protein